MKTKRQGQSKLFVVLATLLAIVFFAFAGKTDVKAAETYTQNYTPTRKFPLKKIEYINRGDNTFDINVKKPVASKYKRQGWINPNINAITPYATATFVPWEMSYYNGKVTVTGYVVNNRIFKLKTYKVKVGVGVDNKIYASTTKTYKNVKDSTIKKVKFSFKSKKALDFVNNSPTWSVRTLKSVW